MKYPLEILAKGARDPKKLTGDEIRELISCYTDLRREHSSVEGRLYQVQWEKTRLEMENRFMIHLFNVKQGELDGDEHTNQQHNLCAYRCPAAGSGGVAGVDASRDRANGSV